MLDFGLTKPSDGCLITHTVEVSIAHLEAIEENVVLGVEFKNMIGIDKSWSLQRILNQLKTNAMCTSWATNGDGLINIPNLMHRQ